MLGIKVLLIEDELKIAEFVTKGLKADGAEVTHVTDGATGLKVALEDAHDVLVLDIMLPAMNGLDLMRELRRSGNLRPIIILSAKVDLEDRLESFEKGANDYLPKPFSFEELAARLRSILRRSSPEKTTKLRCGDLTLDTVSHLAYRLGKEIELTTKEYALLEYLLRNKNRILSRSTITQHVWKHNFDPESNIIDVYIKRLRSKIDKDNSKPIVQSIRGVGYRMREISEDE